jgi:hypothetical protein
MSLEADLDLEHNASALWLFVPKCEPLSQGAGHEALSYTNFRRGSVAITRAGAFRDDEVTVCEAQYLAVDSADFLNGVVCRKGVKWDTKEQRS